MPDDIKAYKPVLLQRTWISDNDAGLSKRYANFAKKTGMVSNLRHFNAKTYKLLQELARDFQEGGRLSQHLKSGFGMNASQYKLMSDNTIEVAGILRKTCEAGKLRFDLDRKAFMKGEETLKQVNCDGR
jgi:hypothetical protein